MKRIVVVGVAIAIVLLVGISWATNAEKEKAAITAAQKWLTLIDAGKYWRVGKNQPNISGMRSNRTSGGKCSSQSERL